ncbi:hypothetical protein NKH16_19920 [Mesorhizobium sp. M1307]|uniref:hypothetical protein n=1 Tax=Mesorhizobium sp. M1307 TaxID=2957079 RepID=UPI00333B0D11
MKKYALILAFLSLISQNTFAADMAGSGLGVLTCAEITRMHNQDGGTEVYTFVWAQGYMSGANVERLVRRENTRDLGAVSNSGQIAYLLNYCDRNPLEPYWFAVKVLMDSLPEHQLAK